MPYTARQHAVPPVRHAVLAAACALLLAAAVPASAQRTDVRTDSAAVLRFGDCPPDFGRPQAPPDDPVRLMAPLTPEYPDEAVRRRQQGIAIFTVAVDADGILTCAVLRSSSGHALLDSAALSAIKRADFHAARHGGVRVAGRLSIPVEFRLGSGEWDADKSPDELQQDVQALERSKRMLEEEQRALEAERARLEEELRAIRERKPPPEQNTKKKK